MKKLSNHTLNPGDALATARKKGVNAGKANKSLIDNPYEKPTNEYKENHSRNAHGAWILGYQSTRR